MRVSLIATVLNESDNIHPFLDALLAQTLAPDEIIIADGGSSDGTVQAIRAYIEEGAPIQLIETPGNNIAEGRNIAIARATGDIIASTDAGGHADPNWLSEIITPFHAASADVDVACGISLIGSTNRRGKSFGILTTDPPDKVDVETFSPSSRCIAFRKTLWERVLGYPEDLYCAEDSLFNQKLRRAGARFVLCPRAVVFWLPPATLRGAARTIFRYALGDGRAQLCPEMYRKILIKTLAALLLALLGLKFRVFWVILALGLAAYYLRLMHLNRNRGDLATLSLAFLYRMLLDPVRLIGYLYGRFFRERAKDAKK